MQQCVLFANVQFLKDDAITKIYLFKILRNIQFFAKIDGNS